MRTILFIESGTLSGGSFVSLYEHVQLLDRQRYRAVVVFLNRTHFVGKLTSLGVPAYVATDLVYSRHVPALVRWLLARILWGVERFAPACYLAGARLAHWPLGRTLYRIGVHERPSLIHLNTQLNRDIFGVFLAETLRIPCISHLRAMPGQRFDRRRAAYANRHVGYYVAVSRATRRQWEAVGIDPAKTMVLYDPLREPAMTPVDIRGEWGIGSDTRWIIGCVGRLSPEKGHDFLLRAFQRFATVVPHSLLCVVGDGPLRSELQAETRRRGLDRLVRFVGHDPRARAMMANMDLVVVPSRVEPFGRVAMEAMQAGTPVIVTNVDGLTEIVEHRKNGLVVEYGDVDALSQAMQSLLLDEQLRVSCLENAKRTTQDRFRVDQYLPQIEHIYGTVLQASSHVKAAAPTE